MSRELSELTSQALTQGYMVSPFAINDATEAALKRNAINNIVRETMMRNFINEHIIDRLTYTRDYGITKSINFMIMGKDMNGKVVGVGHFVYSKSSNYMYLKDFIVSPQCDAKLAVAFMVTSAKDYMAGYGFQPKGIIASPSVKDKHIEAVRFMRDLGMQFMSLQPKHESVMHSSKPKSVFELYKDSHLMDKRVVMLENYGAGSTKMSKELLSKFVSDLKDEEDLTFLLGRFDDSKVSVVSSKTMELSKLNSLLGSIKVTDKKN